jgi:hypothetical protein
MDGLLSFLSPEQQAVADRQARQAMLTQLGFGLLQASTGAPGQRRPSLGQIVGQAGPGAMQAYQGSFDRTLQQIMLQQQMAEQQKQREAQAALMQGLTPEQQQQAAAFPDALRQMVMPTPQVFKPGDILRSPTGEVLYQAPTPPDLTSAQKDYKQAQSEGYTGTFLDYQQQLKRAGSTQITNIVGGQKKLQEELGKRGGEILESSYNEAVAANETLGVINDLRPMLSEGVFAGPFSQAPRLISQVASSLGVAGKDTEETLKRTAATMQGLAKFELNAAAAMRGQGAITENERMLIQRAAGGRLDQFSVPEVLQLLDAMEKTSKFKLAQHQEKVGKVRATARNDPDANALINLYEVKPTDFPTAPRAPSGIDAFNLQDAARQELNRRGIR